MYKIQDCPQHFNHFKTAETQTQFIKAARNKQCHKPSVTNNNT